MNDIPNATTVAFFRERLRKANVIKELFKMFESYRSDQRLENLGVHILDDTFIIVTKKQNGRE